MAKELKKRATRSGAEHVSEADWNAEEARMRADYQKKIDEMKSSDSRSGGRSYTTEHETAEFDKDWKATEEKRNTEYQRKLDEKRAEETARERKQQAEQKKQEIQQSKDRAAHGVEGMAAAAGPEGMAVSAGIEVARNLPMIGGMVDKKLGKLTGEDKKQKEAAKEDKEAAKAARKAEKEAAEEKRKAARAEKIEAMKSAATKGTGIVKGGAVLGGKIAKGAAYGMAGVAAGAASISGSITTFFYVAMVIHIFDAFNGGFSTKAGVPGITGFRFGLYVFLMLYAWFALFGGASQGLESLSKPAAISALAFFLPVLISLAFLAFRTVGIFSTNMEKTITMLLVFIPLWPIIVLFGMAPSENRHLAIWRLIFIGAWVLAGLPTIYKAGLADLNLKGAAIPVYDSVAYFFKLLKTNLATIWIGLKGAPGVISGGIQKQIAYATGDHYTGMVDENQEEPIGVYLEDLQPASNRFYEDDSVVIWGVIKARTLDPEKEISIRTLCYAHTEEVDPNIAVDYYVGYSIRDFFGRPSVRGSLGGGSADIKALGARAGVDIDVDVLKENIVGGDADPTGPDDVFDMDVTLMEEKDLTCEFAPGKLKEGTWYTYFSSVFNFDTYSYLKSYFIDQERLRAIRRQGNDPLDIYGITDKNPIAVYTNGPVAVGMETTQALTGLSHDGRNELRLGITLENRWEGEIEEIRDLVIKIPPSMTLAYCDHNIKPEVCIEDECEDGKYSIVYRLQETSEGGKRGKESLKNIESFQSINCIINVENVDSALGDVPIITHYFKVSADYIYELRKEVVVAVEKSSFE